MKTTFGTWPTFSHSFSGAKMGASERERSLRGSLRSKMATAARKDRRVCRFGPVKQIVGVGKTHLVGLVGGGAEPVHPIFAIDFYGDDGAGLGPADVPVALVGGEDHTFALPMNQVARSGKAKLGVLLVVACVSQVISVAEFLEARVFDPAAFLVVSFGGEDRFGFAREMDGVDAFGIAEAGGCGSVLGPVEHDDLAGVEHNRGIEGAGGFPGGALRRKDGFVRGALPSAEGEIVSWRGKGERGGKQ